MGGIIVRALEKATDKLNIALQYLLIIPYSEPMRFLGFYYPVWFFWD